MTPYIISGIALFVFIGAASYRATAGVILGAFLFNILIGPIVMEIAVRQWNGGPDNPYLYIAAAGIDAFTALCLFILYRIIPSSSKAAPQVVITIALSIFVNASIVNQMINGRSFVYYNYMDIIFVLNCVLLLCLTGGIYESTRTIREFFRHFFYSHHHSYNRIYSVGMGSSANDDHVLEKRK